MKRIIQLLLPLAVALSFVAGVQAQTWPPAVVKIVVPYPPGTEPDVLARDLANQLAKKTGKNFVVDNRPGANAIIGTDLVAKAPADGATLLMVDRLSVVTNPMLYGKVPFDWKTQLKPVTDVAPVRLFITASPNAPFANYREFVAYAKAHPGKVNVGIAGNGHVTHIAMAMLAQTDGFTVNYVPYKGLAPAVTGFLGGEVDVVLAGGLVTQQMTQTKPVKVMALGDAHRASYLPDVPTIVEAGGKPGSIPSTVFSLFAPGATPAAMIQEMNAQVAAVTDEEFAKRYVSRGLEVKTNRPEDVSADLRRDAERYDPLIKSLGIRLE